MVCQDKINKESGGPARVLLVYCEGPSVKERGGVYSDRRRRTSAPNTNDTEGPLEVVRQYSVPHGAYARPNAHVGPMTGVDARARQTPATEGGPLEVVRQYTVPHGAYARPQRVRGPNDAHV